ncbi:MAG: LuxR C-terminal-related transcriptional regulator [Gracilibacteraceae bacterium]|jgi:DNA-binding CsgD family transcriptional regulator|nr:LuxR C-terminal-related transcriptional regulator [Gracilibacteraceae bacterium]
MTSDEVAVYVNLQTVQDYLSEREQAFLVLVDEAGVEITLPSRMPLFCFRLAQTDAVCAACYSYCLAPGRGSEAKEWNWTCSRGLEHIIIQTAFRDAKGTGNGEKRFFLIGGRGSGKDIAELTRITSAFYRLPLSFGRIGTGERAGEESRAENRATGNTYDLTAQELVVLSHMARGLGNKDIAELLYVSSNTVKTHITHILGKMGAKNRTEASLLAVKERLMSDL